MADNNYKIYSFDSLSAYGLTTQGYLIPDTSTIITSLTDSWTFNQPDLVVNFGSPQENIVENQSIFLTQVYSYNQQIFNVWNIGNPTSIYYPEYTRSWCRTLGIPINTAIPSTVIQRFTGVSGTVIPVGTQVFNPITGNIYETTETGTLNILSESNYYADIPAQSVLAGLYFDNANTINTLVSPITGVISTTNPAASVPGYVAETPEQLWLKINTVLRSPLIGIDNAVYLGLYRVTGVVYVNIQYNRTGATVSGIPAYSYAVVVLGGDNQAIVDAIFKYNAGVPWASFGSISLTALTTGGNPFLVSFSRPTYVDFTFTIVLRIVNPPAGITAELSDGIIEFMRKFRIGQACSHENLRTYINNFYLQFIPQNQIQNINITSVPAVVNGVFPIAWNQIYGNITNNISYI